MSYFKLYQRKSRTSLKALTLIARCRLKRQSTNKTSHRQPQWGGSGKTFCAHKLGTGSEKGSVRKLGGHAVLKGVGWPNLFYDAQRGSAEVCANVSFGTRRKGFGQDSGSLKEDTLLIHTTVRASPISTLLPDTKGHALQG